MTPPDKENLADTLDLEALFDTARAAPPQMSQALTARIEADAIAQQPHQPLLRRMLDSIGGPAGFGGLITATVAGFWFGVAPPVETVDPLVLLGTVELVSDEEAMDLTGFAWSGFDLDNEEG